MSFRPAAPLLQSNFFDAKKLVYFQVQKESKVDERGENETEQNKKLN